MLYQSSRNNSEKVTAHVAIINGLADKGGLYTPLPFGADLKVEDLLELSYQELAIKVIGFMMDDLSEEEIRDCVYGAYDEKFDTEDIVPLTKLDDCYVMELWHGPTSAFKDLALTILPRLLTKSYRKEARKDTVAILTATSGDTGKAALSGFADVENTHITVFYPQVGVSDIQKLQMQTSRGNNVKVVAVKGNFDDCQRLVKEAVSSEPVKEALHNVTISSANSINVGRLVPQMVYYYASYIKMVNDHEIKCGDIVDFVVPTGNFGDILAGYLAKLAGLPVGKLICASNSNNVLTDFLKTGTYSTKREFITTISPSMDILVSSNLERLLYMVSGYDDGFVNEMMAQLKEKGEYTIPADMLETIQGCFEGYWTDEDSCRQIIKETYTKEEYVIDPHTAVAMSAMKEYKKDHGDAKVVVLSTASPYKFAADVLEAINGEKHDDAFVAMDKLNELSGMKVPQGLAELKSLPVRFNEAIEVNEGIGCIVDTMRELSHD